MKNSFDTVDSGFEYLYHLFGLLYLDILNAFVKEFKEFGILGLHFHLLLRSTVSMAEHGNY